MGTHTLPGTSITDTPMLLGGIIPGFALIGSMWVVTASTVAFSDANALPMVMLCPFEQLFVLGFFLVPSVFSSVAFRIWQRARERRRGAYSREDSVAARTVGAFTACAVFSSFESLFLIREDRLRLQWWIAGIAVVAASLLFACAFRWLYRRYAQSRAYVLYGVIVGLHCAFVDAMLLLYHQQPVFRAG